MKNDLSSDTDWSITNKQVEEMKNALEQDHGREFSWEESQKAVQDLQTLANIAGDLALEEIRREDKLISSPKGFLFDRPGYNCQVCDGPANEGNAWFDKYGLKCMNCQEAINKKIIPGSVAKNKASWYSAVELEIYFNITRKFLARYIKQGMLKERIIQGTGKKIHMQLFLLKDNKDFLPPKKLLRSRIVMEEKNGKQYYTSEPWYEYADMRLVEKIAKYDIIDCLKETLLATAQGD